MGKLRHTEVNLPQITLLVTDLPLGDMIIYEMERPLQDQIIFLPSALETLLSLSLVWPFE
jgi:hypothetical protein